MKNQENPPTRRFSPGKNEMKNVICVLLTPFMSLCTTTSTSAMTGIFSLNSMEPGKPLRLTDTTPLWRHSTQDRGEGRVSKKGGGTDGRWLGSSFLGYVNEGGGLLKTQDCKPVREIILCQNGTSKTGHSPSVPKQRSSWRRASRLTCGDAQKIAPD